MSGDEPSTHEERLARAAREAATRLLSRRLRSVGELRRRLLAAEHDPEVVEQTLSWLQGHGLLDDRAFASAFVHDAVALKGSGRFKIRRDLQQHGVDEALIDEVLDEEYPREDEAEVAAELAAKKAELLAGLPAQTRRRRLAAYLQRRGINPELVRGLVDEHVPFRGGWSDEG